MTRHAHLPVHAILLLVLLALAVACREPQPPTVDLSSRTVSGIDSIARRATRGQVSGLAIAIGHAGDVVITAGYGWAERGVWRPITEETVFPIGQISEQFAAAATLMLVERGELELDAALSRYLPELVGHAAALTLRQLLNHTSGLWDYRPTAEAVWRERGEAVPEELSLAEARSRGPQHEPGAEWAPTSTGYLLIGSLLERVSGRGYGDFLAEELLVPLGLHSVYLCADQPADPRRANEYVHEGSFRPSTLWERPLSTAALGICSNAHDVARWEIALASGEVVGDSILGLMLEPTPLQDGARVDYGLGTRLGELEGLRKFGATGGSASVRSAVAHYPELDLTVAILINTESESLGYQDAADLETSLTRLIAHLPVESVSR